MLKNKILRLISIGFFVLSPHIVFGVGFEKLTIPMEKWIKSFGIGSIEKSLLNSAKYTKFGGKIVAKRNETFMPNIRGADGKTNLERMKEGLSPIGMDGKFVELHHLKQKDNGMIVELTRTEHKQNHGVLHRYKGKGESEIDRKKFGEWKSEYWKARAKEFE